MTVVGQKIVICILFDFILFIVVISTGQRDVDDHNDDREYEEVRGSRDAVVYSQLNQPRNDVVNVVYNNVQHPSTDQHYEELQPQDVMDDGAMYSQLQQPPASKTGQQHPADQDYENVALS